jgi:hypothetical protein
MLLDRKELQEAADQEAVCSSLSEWSTSFVGGVEFSTSEKMRIRL